MRRLFILFVLLTLAGPARADSGADIQKILADPAALPELDGPHKAELDRFYAQRGYQPAWSLSDKESARKTDRFLESVDALVTYHGLVRSRYNIDAMRKLTSSKDDADRQRLEFMISESLLQLAHDLHGDSVNLDDFFTGWNFHRQQADITAQLSEAMAAGKLEAFFDHIAPQNDAYRELAHILQDYRAIEATSGDGKWAKVDPGPSLKPDDRNPRVAQVRARLTAEGYVTPPPPEGSDFFDGALATQVSDYQNRNGLAPDGHVGGKTLDALNVSLTERVDQIRANMERWRHMPEDFPGDRYVVVNIPDFSVTVVEDGRPVYMSAVVVGKPDRQTPFINSKIVNMVVDPPWNVPVSIAKKDILPKLRKNPHYLETLGISIAGRDTDPSGSNVDWRHISDDDFHYQLKQAPGDLNSLGKLKFNFSNPFDVYMHGTPHQELFARAERAFSSGCVRLEDPTQFGVVMMKYNQDKGGWSEDRIEAEIDQGQTHWVTLAKPIPVYFLYWSVLAAEDGRANFRKDIYGYDSSLIEKMRNSDAGNQ